MDPRSKSECGSETPDRGSIQGIGAILLSVSGRWPVKRKVGLVLKGDRSSVQSSGFVCLGITGRECHGHGQIIESFPGLNIRNQLLT